MKMKLLWFVFLFAFVKGIGQTTFTCTSTGTVCPCTYGSSKAEFYSNYHGENSNYFSINTPTITRNDPTINFATDGGWGSIVPPATGSNANPDNYSTRWSGRIFLASGSYTFWLTSDDGSYFWLGGNALPVNPVNGSSFINNGGLHSPATVSAVGNFTADCLQDFKIHFGEQGGNNQCVLEYACTSRGITRQAIPASLYCPCMSNAALPIELQDFYGKANKDNIMLYWNTATEKNNSFFSVYKSGDGENWSLLGEETGAGNSQSLKKYSIADNSPLQGLNYYYMTQTDRDGTVKKFEVIVIDYNNIQTYLNVYPNPFKNLVTITSTSDWKSSDEVKVFDALGQELKVPLKRTSAGSIEINTEDWPGGAYTVKIQTAYQVIFRKIIKG